MKKTSHLLLLSFLISNSYLLIPKHVRADWFIDRSGTLVQVDGAILGDDDTVDEVEDAKEVENEVKDKSDDSAVTSNKRAEEAKNEALRKQQEKSRELLKKQTEARLKNQESNPRSSNVEIRTQEGKTKIKQEVKDAAGRLVNKKEVEMKEGEALHIEQVDGSIVEVKSDDKGRLEMVKNKVRTASDLKLNVNDKNEISVTLPNGKSKEISLPDKALERLVTNGIIAPLGDGEETQYELIAGKSGEPAYAVEGEVEKKVFGLFKLKFAQKLEVAATASDDGTVEAGDVVESESLETSPWRKFLERLSR
jgi:hypothetical protein